MAKAKFKKGSNVRVSYDAVAEYKVAEIKEITTFEYLIESKDGARRWTSQSNLRRAKAKRK